MFNRPPTTLGTAPAALEAEHETNNGQVPFYISGASKKGRMFQKGTFNHAGLPTVPRLADSNLSLVTVANHRCVLLLWDTMLYFCMSGKQYGQHSDEGAPADLG